MLSSKDILKQYWGYDGFRSIQEDIIKSIVSGKDTMAYLPTGGGKSICYQVPGLMQDGIVVVISPLISLMLDQVRSLQKRGIKASYLQMGQSRREVERILDNCVYGNVKFLYVSPERIQSSFFRDRFEVMPVSFIAIDEAHCISQWGHDFRPSYLKIKELREIKQVPIITLTASATERVRGDIKEQLELSNENTFQGDFERNNISVIVDEVKNKQVPYIEALSKETKSTITYTSTRRMTKEISSLAKRSGRSVSFYHGGLKTKERESIQGRWIKNELQHIVATNAFGMGIDKSDVGMVYHYNIPASIEAYYQEIGRAGRDGNASKAILRYNKTDIEYLNKQLALKFPSFDMIRKVYAAVFNYFDIPVGSGLEQTFSFDIIEFSNTYNIDVVNAYNSIKELARNGHWVLQEDAYRPASIQVLGTREEVYSISLKKGTVANIMQALLRTYEGINAVKTKINEVKLAASLSIPKRELVEVLTRLTKSGLVDYQPEVSSSLLTVLVARLSKADILIDTKQYKEKQKVAEEKLAAIEHYLTISTCRSQYILDYFGVNSKPCGSCDNCQLAAKQKQVQRFSEIEKVIYDSIVETPLSLNDIEHQNKGYLPEQIRKAIQVLLDEGFVVRGVEGSYSVVK